jgi:chorismate synthase
MGSNSFGNHFTVTTWGESHGKEIGLVIDGCPPLVPITEEEINLALAKRAPGKTPWTSPRLEPDQAYILSGLLEGKTTGQPIAISIPNRDAKPGSYQGLENILRPGHANATYLKKYGIFDHKGGGRASARETVARVAAGAVAEKVLQGVKVTAYLKAIGEIEAETIDLDHLQKSPLFFPDPKREVEAIRLLEAIRQEGDSIGGIVEVVAQGVPAGLGDPVYDKMEAKLASYMLSIPASKGFEIGAGFSASKMRGSEHNDLFVSKDLTATNHAGGTLGGIATGMPIIARVAFKPTSSIQKEQKTVTCDGEPTLFSLPAGSRHDPSVAIRAVPVVKAMMLLAICDYWIKERLHVTNQTSQIPSGEPRHCPR